MESVILLFSEVPEPGRTRSALTYAQGGILSDKQAANFYRRSLIDTLNACSKMTPTKIYICCNGDGDLEKMQKIIDATVCPDKIEIYGDHGGKFGECVDECVKAIKDKEEGKLLVLLSGDLPLIQPHIVDNILAKTSLARFPALGVCPSQSGATSVIVMSPDAELSYSDMFDKPNHNRSLEEFIDSAMVKGYPIYLGETVPDVDNVVDMASMISLINALKMAAKSDNSLVLPIKVIEYLNKLGLTATAPSSKTDDEVCADCSY